jgi:hypothetical protein
MKPNDRYRQVWPATEATQSSKPGAVWLGVTIVAQLLATVGTVYLIVVFAFSL